MAANHSILISLCSGETANKRWETCSGGGGSSKWTQVVQGRLKLPVCQQSIKVPHTHLHTGTYTHTQNQLVYGFLNQTTNMIRHEISESITRLLEAMNMKLLTACKYCKTSPVEINGRPSSEVKCKTPEALTVFTKKLLAYDDVFVQCKLTRLCPN